MCIYTLCIFWTVALIASGLCGYYATTIFMDGKAGYKPTPKGVHQFWLNFVGSFVGWIALWALFLKYHGLFYGYSVTPNLWHVFAALIAFIGITGYLPAMIIPPLASLAKAIDTIAIAIAKWLTK